MTVIDFPGTTKGEVSVEDVMEGAKLLQMVIIIGYDKDGNEYYATSSGDIGECYFLAGKFMRFLEDISNDK